MAVLEQEGTGSPCRWSITSTSVLLNVVGPLWDLTTQAQERVRDRAFGLVTGPISAPPGR